MSDDERQARPSKGSPMTEMVKAGLERGAEVYLVQVMTSEWKRSRCAATGHNVTVWTTVKAALSRERAAELLAELGHNHRVVPVELDAAAPDDDLPEWAWVRVSRSPERVKADEAALAQRAGAMSARVKGDQEPPSVRGRTERAAGTWRVGDR